MQGNKTRFVSKLTVPGVMRLVSWLLVLWNQKSWGKATKAQGFRPLVLFAEVPKIFL